MAVAHTKRGEQSAADAATQDLPLVQTAARTIDTTADAFKASIDGKTLTTRGDTTEAHRAWAGKHGRRLTNLYGYDEPGTIATLGGHSSAHGSCQPWTLTGQP